MVDDYGHHPTELQQTLGALRAGWPGCRVVMLFQPHRPSRTRELYEDFVRVLSSVDQLILLEVYAAGEVALPGADSRSLARSIRGRGRVDPHYAQDREEALELLHGLARPGDLILIQGAGDIGRLADELMRPAR